MATLTAYSTSGDGFVRNNGAGSWSSLQSAGTGTVASQFNPALVQCDGTTADKYIDRGIFSFDLSTIPPNSTINSATLSLYVTAESHAAGGAVGITSASPASTTTLATSDYGLVGSTEYATRINFASATTSAYNNFALNASGLTYLGTKLGTYAGFAARGSFDIDNSAPGTTVYSNWSVSTSEQSGTSQDPKLTVDYTVPTRTTSDTWAWSDTNSVSGSGGTRIGYIRTTSDAWAWSDAPTIYRRARVDVLVRNAGSTTTIATSSYTGGATLNVSSTASFPSSGRVLLQASSGLQQGRVVYTGKTSTTFTGCTFTSFLGSSTFTVGSAVCAYDAESHFPQVTKLDTTDHPPLMVSYTQHGSHAGMDGGIQFKITNDGGVTFGSELPVISSPANGDGWGVYGHTMARMKNGRLFCMWYEHKYDYNTPGTISNFWTMASYSDDNGTSWSTPVEYDTPFAYGPRAGSTGFGCEVYTGSGSNSTYGDLYVPVYGNDDGIQVKTSGEPYRWYSKLMKITDGGASGTWTEVGTMATYAQVGNRACGEPGLAMLSDNLWVAHFRVEPKASGEDAPSPPYYYGFQRWQATSTDQGVTWTGHARVNPLANGGVVFQLPGGTLISSGQDIGRASGCTDYISFDQGATWAFNRVETTDPTYAYYNGSDAALIIDDPTVSRNTVFTWGDETSDQLGARVQFRWFFDPARTYDTWTWADTAVQTHAQGRSTSDAWAWSDSSVAPTLRDTSDSWAWTDTNTRVYTQSRFTPYPFGGIYETWNWSETAVGDLVRTRTTADAWAWSDVASRASLLFSRTSISDFFSYAPDRWTWSESASGSTSAGLITDWWAWADFASVATLITGAEGESGFWIQSVVGAEVVLDGVVDASLTFTAVV